MLEAEADRHAVALARGNAAWPGVVVEPDALRAYFEQRIAAGADWAAQPLEDLYLACACAAGDAVALDAFEASYMREITVAAAKLRAAPGIVDEARQVVRDLLFVGKPDRQPAIASYTGRGDLRGWVRVIAMREVLRLCKRDSREVSTGDDQLLDALSPANDPELELLKTTYRDEFAAAFSAAVNELEPRERTLLRYNVIDGLGVESIGGLYKVHHSTAARWLAKARESLLTGTRKQLADRLRISGTEVESVLRLIRSRIDVSIERLLDK